jgi:2-C-methyl-D-erythritol 4-phosphate cytidylyltransferase
MKTIGVILASGIGSRTGSYIPKQFVKAHGKLIIEYAIEAFQKANLPIIVAVPPGYKDTFKWPVIIIEGGKERTDTIRNVLEELKKHDADYVIFHDSARPLITSDIILATQQKLYSGHDVLITSSKVTDSLLSLQDLDLVDRSNYRLLQTPEAFKVDKLLKAYESSGQDYTLIAGPLLNDSTLCIFEPEFYNFKITYPEDIRIAEKLLVSDGTIPKAKQSLAILKNKKVLVLGGSGGIGKAVINELSESCFVFAPGHKELDLATENWSVGQDKYDYIVYTAGLCYSDKEITKELRDQMFLVNTYSIDRLTQLAPGIMNPGGSIVVIGSSAATNGRPGFSYYSASKVAANAIVQARAVELKKQNIHINCLCPAKTKTPMVEKTKTSNDDSYFLEPEYVAKTIITGLLTLEYGKIWYLYKGLDT